MEQCIVDSPSQLSDLLPRLVAADRIALDAESDGLFRYRAQLCTLQLRAGDVLAVIDTLAVPDLMPLAPVLGADGPLKVVHDVSFDARLLVRYDLVLDRVFDTALAARLLGERGTGLSTLVEARCNVTLDKALQHHDWGQRPLASHALSYLVDDVAHLFCLHDSLARDVAALDIAAELAEETRYTLDQATRVQAAAPKPLWLRVKGGDALPPEAQAVLRALCLTREQIAQARDVPPFRVLHDRTLLALATARPERPQALRQVLGRMLPRTARDLIPELIQAITHGLAAGAPPPEELAALVNPVPPEERALRRRIAKALSTWRKAEAARRGVDAQVVLPGHGMHDLARRRPADPVALAAVPGLGACRIDRYGATWLALIARVGDAR